MPLTVDEGSFYEKDNLTIFARCCQEMGIDPNDCVSVSMFERGNVAFAPLRDV